MSSLRALSRHRSWLHAAVTLAAVAVLTLWTIPGPLLAHGQATNDETRTFLKALAAAIPDFGSLAGSKLDGDYCADRVPNNAVICNGATVLIDLDVTGMGYPLQGFLPEVPAGVDAGSVMVSRISVSNRSLRATLPSSWGGLVNLERLLLNRNQLYGTLPPEYAGLTRLINVNLANNQLRGSLPEEYAALSSLFSLRLSNNFFEGSLPASWGTGLRGLRGTFGLEMIAAGAFCGCVPESWRENEGMVSAVVVELPTNVRDANCAADWCQERPQPSSSQPTEPSTSNNQPSGSHSQPSQSNSPDPVEPSSSGNPNPVDPSSSGAPTSDPSTDGFFRFLSAACPPGTLDGIPKDALGGPRREVCCEPYGTSRPNSATKYCGNDIAAMGMTGRAQCVSSVLGHPFSCCAEITAGGWVRSDGRTCTGGDGVAGAVNPSPLALLAATVATFAVIAGA